MKISASVHNAGASHAVRVSTGGTEQSVAVSAKTTGDGSAVNGGEFLMLALATCYCNDLYREAARMGIAITGVDVVASADFDGVGLAATNITYGAKVDTDASAAAVAALLRQTDAVAEIHNTVRTGVAVRLVDVV